MTFHNDLFSWMYNALVPKSLSPFIPNEDDIFLVSFPRSGNTWMRVILSELFYGESGDSLADLEKYVPDIHVQLRNWQVIDSKTHLVKSHYPLNDIFPTQMYKKVIYVVRDPRDVVISHYRYVSKLGYYNLDFSQFVLDWINGRIWPCSWVEHVNSWLGDGTVGRGISVFVVKYEELKQNPQEQIIKLSNFLGLSMQSSEVERIVEKSTVEVMREKEKAGLREDETAKDFTFIGPAKSKQWMRVLSKYQCKLIIEYTGELMGKFGYL